MTKREAHLFFRHSPEDDLEEVWEQRFFNQKQYFLTHTPTPLTWKSKLKRLFKEYCAYLVLTDQNEMEYKEPQQVTKQVTQQINFSDRFIAAFHEYHQLKNQHKSEVLQAHSFPDLSRVVMHWLNTEFEYATYWSHPISKEHEIQVFISKEPDPMELLKDLKEVESTLGKTTIEELKDNYNNLPENIKKEVKRLTLLSKS